jgi:hypothetical protein
MPEEGKTQRRPPQTTAASRARESERLRIKNAAEADFMRKHLRLDNEGLAVPTTQAGREAERRKLLEFPPMPEHVRLELEQIVRLYGLPLAALSSDVAAFIVRRSNFEFRSVASRKRSGRPPLFTADELRQLLQVMGMEPADLAEMLTTTKPQKHSLYGSINRWMTGENYPTTGIALRVNALIERRVRRTYASESGSRASSTNPDTVRRRAQWNAQKVAKDVPLAPSARSGYDGDAEAQAATVGDAAAARRRRRGAIRTVQKGGGLPTVRRGLQQRTGGLGADGPTADGRPGEPDRDGGRLA